jgi:formylglycine-generating enzyme required for sulfatase activity
MSTVPVGNVGNENDPFTGNLYGGVSYSYRIGTTEVTNAQYADFLNAKAASDPLSLYNTSMGSDVRGGIARSGVSGSFTYATKTNMGDKPVNYVSWYDSIRFANWLNNGQGNGDTESGAYTLGALDAGGVPTNGNNITRNVGATWFLPSENEWYKSAYYQPATQGGPPENYWIFATGVNVTVATANSVGDISNPGNNVVNYLGVAGWNGSGQGGNVTTVGSAGPLSQSFYGTSDQSGNVSEWNDTFFTSFGKSLRGVRGGAFDSVSDELWPSARTGQPPTIESEGLGFRVANVPEPSTGVLAALGLAGMALAMRRRLAC